MRRHIMAAIAVLVGVSTHAARAQAQHKPHHPVQPDSSAQADTSMRGPMSGHELTPGVLDLPVTRMGSGTSWLPDAAPMHAVHYQAGTWGLMVHGLVFGMYDKQFTRRGEDQVNSLNWGMVMATRPVGPGSLQLRGMFSGEPFTVGARGYPLLLQSGESYKGQPLHDRQHPHDLFMELAALYERPIAHNLALSVYVAPVGEPAVGPVAFPHRPSAASDPLAPLAHHWQDATHISFGVLTAGLFTRTLKVEGSWFNGREPDEDRYNFDYSGRSLDSYSGRVTVNPTPNWSVSGSYAFLKSPDALRPTESVHRVNAAVLYSKPTTRGGDWSSALIYGANKHSGGEWENSFTAESNLELDGHNSVFGRLNYARKGAEDLAVVDSVPATEFNIGSVELGYVREVGSLGRATIGVGASGTLGFVPADLEPIYGTRTPTGLAVYFRIRPKAMQMGHEMMNHPMGQRDSMPGMPMRTDSMPGMHMPKDSMPGMQMPSDSTPRKRSPHDSMPGMHRRRDAKPRTRTPHDSMPGMRMQSDSVPHKSTPHDSMPGMRMDLERPINPDRGPTGRDQ